MSRKRGTHGISKRMETSGPILLPIKIETPDPDLISTISDNSYSDTEQNNFLEQTTDANVSTAIGTTMWLSSNSLDSPHSQEQEFLNDSEEILQQTSLKSLELPVELEKQDSLVTKQKRPRRSRDISVGVVRDSFKRVILNLHDTSKGTPTNRSDNTIKPSQLLSSVLNDLFSESEKNTPLVTNDGQNLDGTAIMEEIDGDYDPTIKIEVLDVPITSEKSDETDEFVGSCIQPETETPYQDLVQSNEVVDFITGDSDQVSTTSNGSEVTVKIEPDEDPLGFGISSGQASTSFINHEPPTSLNQTSQDRTYLKTYCRKKGQSKSNSNGTGNVLPHKRFEDERKCLVCDAFFLSGDALATHLYGHIPLEIWQSKALGFGNSTSNSNNLIERNNIFSSIAQVHDSDDMEEPSDSLLVDPLSLVSIKTEVNETGIEIQNKTDTFATFIDGSSSLDRRTEFEKRYPSLSKRPLVLKSNKSRISKKMKRVEVPNLNSMVNSAAHISGAKMITARQKNANFKPEVKTPVPPQKSQAKIFKPQRRDGSNCPFGFGDVVQKLVENGKILIK